MKKDLGRQHIFFLKDKGLKMMAQGGERAMGLTQIIAHSYCWLSISNFRSKYQTNWLTILYAKFANGV